MKKLMTIAVMAGLSADVSNCNGYIGIKGGILSSKNKLSLFGNHSFSSAIGTLVNLSSDQTITSNQFAIGLLLGYKMTLNKRFSTFIEEDIEFTFGDEKGGKFNTSPLSVTASDEYAFIKQRFSFGITPGLTYEINDRFEVLAGLRLNYANYTVHAYHMHQGAIVQGDNVSVEKFVFGVEPLIGGTLKVNEKMSARLTVGYNYSNKITAIDNYQNVPGNLVSGTAGIKIKPSGFAVRVSFIHNF